MIIVNTDNMRIVGGMNISKNRNGISDVKPLQYQIDFDTLRYTYIPNLEDILERIAL